MERHLGEIIEGLSKLSSKERLLFAGITCDHLYRNYVDFPQKPVRDNFQILREAIDAIYNHITNDSLNTVNDIQTLMDKVEISMPHADTSPQAKAYLALDACTAVLSSLEYIITSDPDCIVAVATYAANTARTYIRLRDGLTSGEALTIPEIADDLLMIREKQRQLKLIWTITEADISKVTDTFIENLRDKFAMVNINDG